jgi:putative Mg2+ transporter-C (MgtC) family protein
MIDLTTICIRFLITFFFALIFGLERQRSHKPIGFGTFIFVALGGCGLSMVALTLVPDNPLSLLGAIVTGIGFLGAGALIKTTDHIFGFNTAASIWLFAIIGLIIGTGQYIIGCIIFLLIWIVIVIDKLLEKRGIGSYQKKLQIVTNQHIGADDLLPILKPKSYKIVSMDVNLKEKQSTLLLLVEGSKTNIDGIPKKLCDVDWVESFKIE